MPGSSDAGQPFKSTIEKPRKLSLIEHISGQPLRWEEDALQVEGEVREEMIQVMV